MITKIGKEVERRRKKSIRESALVGTAAGIGAPLTATVASQLVGTPLALKVMTSKSQDFTPAEADQLIQNMVGNKRNINVVDTSGSFIGRLRSHFNPATQTVMAPKDSYILAHELGHATGLLGRGKTLGQIGAFFSHGLGGPKFAPIVRGIDSAQKAYNREVGLPESEDSTTLGALSTASQLGTAAQLAEEGQASIRGIRAVGKLQGAAGMLRAAKILGPAYGTYAAAAVGSHALAPWVGGKIGKYLGKANMESESR